jgi:ligand-binding SRPBCC domain-containing protein
VDVALRSPFSSWRHEHRFEALGRDRSRLTDRVTYTLPGGPVGWIADRVLVRRMLRKAFAQRHRNTKILMERG